MSQRFEGKDWTSNQKVVTDEKNWKAWKSIRNSVMNEELFDNSVMNDKFVKNFVMSAEIDPKVVRDLSMFSLVDGTVCNFSINKCWKNFLM